MTKAWNSKTRFCGEKSENSPWLGNSLPLSEIYGDRPFVRFSIPKMVRFFRFLIVHTRDTRTPKQYLTERTNQFVKWFYTFQSNIMVSQAHWIASNYNQIKFNMNVFELEDFENTKRPSILEGKRNAIFGLNNLWFSFLFCFIFNKGLALNFSLLTRKPFNGNSNC